MKADGHVALDIAKFLGISRATLYRYLADESRVGLSVRDPIGSTANPSLSTVFGCGGSRYEYCYRGLSWRRA
ncbi:MAG: Helix-turn-helix domain of resolvase [Mycobacterium sp.]|jgi:predicted DNA-binding transcriptional regulator YafY|nr:Helix-turn-helix domain of resolvase [Mycobacterium sp.]